MLAREKKFIGITELLIRTCSSVRKNEPYANENVHIFREL